MLNTDGHKQSLLAQLWLKEALLNRFESLVTKSNNAELSSVLPLWWTAEFRHDSLVWFGGDEDTFTVNLADKNDETKMWLLLGKLDPVNPIYQLNCTQEAQNQLQRLCR